MNVGAVISKLRKQRRMSQMALSDSVNITQGYLSLIEQNKKEPHISTLKEIAKALDVPLPILFYLSLEEDDVPMHKRELYSSINPALKAFVSSVFETNEKSKEPSKD